MSSILCIGDLHFQPSTIKESDTLCSEILRVITERLDEIDYVVVLGDVLHTHERINMQCQIYAFKFLKQLAYLKEVVIVVGNHDRINEKDFLSDYHSLSGVDMHPKITIASKPLAFRGSLFVPYVEPGRFLEAMKTAWTLDEIKGCKGIFAHQEFKGCKMGAIVSVVGDEWPANYPHVVTGHIHDYQQLGNVLYTGTPIQHGYGCTVKKSISLIDIVEGKLHEERIQLNVTKRVTVRMNAKQVMSAEHADKRDLLMRRLVITGTSGDVALVTKSDLYRVLKKKYDKVALKFISDDVSSVVVNNSTVKETENFIQFVRSHLNAGGRKLFDTNMATMIV